MENEIKIQFKEYEFYFDSKIKLSWSNFEKLAKDTIGLMEIRNSTSHIGCAISGYTPILFRAHKIYRYYE